MATVKTQINTTTVYGSFLTANGTSNAVARASDGRLWAVYREAGAIVGEDVDVFAAYSDDDGASWTEEVAVDEVRAGGSFGFAILIDSNDVPIVLYITRPATGNHKVWYVDRSGGSWGTPEEVITAGTTNTVGLKACIDSADNVHIVFLEGSGGDGVIYVTGVSGSWGSEEKLEATGTRPHIAVASDNEPYVSYAYGITEIRMRYKTGGVWQTAEVVSDDIGYYGGPVIALNSDDDVYIGFTAKSSGVIGGDSEVYYNKRTSGSWGTAVMVATPTVGKNFTRPLMTIDTEDNVYFIYQESSGGNDIVYYKKLTSVGVLGSQQTLVDDLPEPGANPATYAGLWAKFPSSCVVSADIQPVVVLFDWTGADKLYYVRTSLFIPKIMIF